MARRAARRRARLHALERDPTRPRDRATGRSTAAAESPSRRPGRAAPQRRRASSSSRWRRPSGRAAYIAGTFDTKGRELFFLRSCLEKLGLRTVTVDLATSGKPSPAMVHPREVARHHPKGERAVFTGDRGSAVTEMAVAFEHFVARRRDLGGLISAGGSGGTALATPAMRRLPIGVPKVMVSTVASGDVKPYVGPSDICMMYSVTDVSGINRISEKVLANAAHALAGHDRLFGRAAAGETKPALGLTMFGLTTPCVQAVTQAARGALRLPRLPRHRHRRPVDGEAGRLGPARRRDRRHHHRDRRRARGRRAVRRARAAGRDASGPRMPYVGSCGALDMVNFWAMDTVPAQFRSRKLHRHNPNVTLMRTTPTRCARIGRFIVDKLNRMEGPVRFLIPEGGVSGLDAPGKPFWDPAADRALFDVDRRRASAPARTGR